MIFAGDIDLVCCGRVDGSTGLLTFSRGNVICVNGGVGVFQLTLGQGGVDANEMIPHVITAEGLGLPVHVITWINTSDTIKTIIFRDSTDALMNPTFFYFNIYRIRP